MVRLQWRLLPLYLIGLSVRRRIHPGEGLFLFLATPRVRLVLKDFCDGCGKGRTEQLEIMVISSMKDGQKQQSLKMKTTEYENQV